MYSYNLQRCILTVRDSTGFAFLVIPYFRVGSSALWRAVEPRKLTIPSGETATVRLKLDLTHRTQREIGQKERPFLVEATPVFKSGRGQGAGWKLTGVLKSRVTLDSLAIYFGESPVQ